jgi:hypothetical protein
MIDFILNKLDLIFNDFQIKINNSENLCELESVHYLNRNVPNYNPLINQQFYLLKYFPAYFFEYFEMYKRLINDGFINNLLDNDIPLNILSIGCGCGLDYYGLEYALRNTNRNCNTCVIYSGIDIINWSYRDNLNNTTCYFSNIDILNCHSLDNNDYNLIVFPKSIHEFRENFDNLLTLLRNTDFSMDTIIIMGSISKEKALSEEDIQNFKKIENIFIEDHNLIDIGRYDEIIKHPQIGIFKNIYNFDYPENIKDYLLNLKTFCKNKSLCDKEICVLKDLRPVPIQYTDYMKYRIKVFEKK